MSSRMERINVLSNDSTDQPNLPQVPDSVVSRIWICLEKTGPPKKAPRPIPLSSLVILCKFIVVDGAVCLVYSIRAIGSSIIRQSR